MKRFNRLNGLILASIVNKTSPGKVHAYWRIDGLALENFKPRTKTRSKSSFRASLS
jgi:hypothetical protein